MKSLCLLSASLTLCSALLISSAHAKEELDAPSADTLEATEKLIKEQVEQSAPLDLAYSVNITPEAEAAQPDKLVETLKGAAGQQRPPKKSASPKDGQIVYHKDTDTFRAQVEAPAWQKIKSDQRSFATFGRNYINRLHCSGTITDVIFPTTKGLELELKNGGHDLFVQVGPDVPADITYYPVDMYVICDSEVFQIASIVDSKYPATNTELMLSGGIRPESIKPYENAVQRAQSLPHEEKIAKILKRVWNDDPLAYWSRKTVNKACSGIGIPCRLRQSMETGIDGLVAWDFVAPASAEIHELLAGLSPHVSGRIISIGRVRLKEGQRVIILTSNQAVAK